jgi:hypothetical protein
VVIAMIRSLLLVALLPLAATARAQPATADCIRADPSPVLATQAIKAHAFARVGAREAEETGVLPDGLEVQVLHSGCESYSLVYVFRLPDAGHTASDASFWGRRAARVMRTIAAAGGPDQSVAIARRLARLHGRNAYAYGDRIALVDGYETASLRVEHTAPGEVEVRVGYDVAL